MSKEKKIDWVVCGRFIGTATGWDQSDTYQMCIYDFIPCVELKGVLNPGNLSIDFDKGLIEGDFTEDGVPAFSLDLIETLAPCQKRKV